MHVKLLQLHPTLYNSTDCSVPATLSMGFSRQEYWSGLPYPSPNIKMDMDKIVHAFL